MNAPAQPSTDNTILFPPGRIVQGDLYEAQTKDMKGNPLVAKSGQNVGQPIVRYFFAVAIPKTQAQWWSEQWGAKVLALANAAWSQGQTQYPKFAWKIEDGDDATPNFERGGRRNCDSEGFKGCWIVKFTSGFAPKIFDTQASPMLQPGLVKRGFWVEVLGSVNSNNDTTKPGIHMNHNMVAFRAPDKEIVSGPDPRSVGFGQAALPPGVTAAPAGSAAFPSPTPAPVSYAPGMAPAAPTGVPAAVPGAYATPAPAVPAATPAPVPVQAHPGFIAPPGVAPAPAAPPAPVVPAAAPAPAPAPAADPLGAPAGYRMANPQGARYEQYRQNGWVDAAMIAAGHMVRL